MPHLIVVALVVLGIVLGVIGATIAKQMFERRRRNPGASDEARALGGFGKDLGDG